jgi:serine/threonine-protein kinase RsbW
MRTSLDTLTVQAELDHLTAIRGFVRTQADRQGLDQESVYDLMLAVEEAVVNIIRHGYGEDASGPIQIEAAIDDGAFVVVIRDRAVVFDPTAGSMFDPNTPLAGRRLGGMGLYMIARSVDDCAHRPRPAGGNELTLIKHHPKQRETP